MSLVAGVLPPWLAAALGGGLGTLVGSFLGAAAVRLPQGRSVLTGRSACEGCGATLSPAELVPIVSFVAQRGRCRRCGAPIDHMQPAAEVGGAVVGAMALAMIDDPLIVLLTLALGWQLLLLGLLDLRHFWLPRPLVLLVAATGAAAVVVREGPLLALVGDALSGGALGYALPWLAAVLYRRVRGREGLGAGDPGLLGAIGVWVGPLGVTMTLLGGSLIGLAGAAGLVVAGRTITARTMLPLGSALALAGWPVWLLQHV